MRDFYSLHFVCTLEHQTKWICQKQADFQIPYLNFEIWLGFVFLWVKLMGPVTKIENIKTDATKILRPTHFGE